MKSFHQQYNPQNKTQQAQEVQKKSTEGEDAPQLPNPPNHHSMNIAARTARKMCRPRKNDYGLRCVESDVSLVCPVVGKAAAQTNGLATAWNATFGASTSAAPFVQALDKFNRPVAIDWGFPPEHLSTVRKLFEGGVMLWWFAADWAVARRKFKERGTISMGHFDIQIRKIEAALPEINALFCSHVEYVLPSTGIYTPPDEI